MKTKSVFWLLVVVVLIIMPILAACANTTPPAEEPLVITSHGIGIGYGGLCLICHGVGSGEDEFPADHTEYLLETCALPECHPVAEE